MSSHTLPIAPALTREPQLNPIKRHELCFAPVSPPVGTHLGTTESKTKPRVSRALTSSSALALVCRAIPSLHLFPRLQHLLFTPRTPLPHFHRRCHWLLSAMAMHSTTNSFHEDDTTMQAMEEEQVPLGRWAAFRQRCRNVGNTMRGIDARVSKSTLGRTFRLTGCGHVSITLTHCWIQSADG